MRKLIYIFIACLFLLSGSPANYVSKVNISETPVYVPLAFPGVVGFGKNATGGKGGSVIFVTNLNNSGSGSLREALTTSGARTIIFRVGGTITLTSVIYVSSGNLTIAGETAPGGGILLKGGGLQINGSNVIIRHIRFRSGPTSPSDSDAFSIQAPYGSTIENIVIDHCSFSWGVDENFNISGSDSSISKNITVQNCIISEGGYGVLLYKNVQNVTFYQNLLAFNSERNIRSQWGYGSTIFTYEMINNLIYAWSTGATVPSLAQKFTILNNKYKKSSGVSPSGDGTTIISCQPTLGVGDEAWTYAYVSGNDIPSGMPLNNSRLDPYLKGSTYASSGISAYSTSSIEGNILSHVGASLPARDAVDTRIVASYNAGTGSSASSGTYPTIASGTPYTDSDSDGMDDAWETTTFGNLSKGNNGFDLSADYTNLQMFLSYLAGDESTPPPAPTCSDGIQNGDETGIDCGGSCSPCGGIEPGTGAGARAFMNYLLTD